MGLFDWFKKPASNTQVFTPPQRPVEPVPKAADPVRSAFQPNSNTNTIEENRAKANRGYREHAAVVEGWIWLAPLQARSCLLCILRNGTEYPVTQDFEPCHEGCRCTSIAKTRSLAEIVGDPSIPDTRPKIEPGDIWFVRQPVATQRSIMGDEAFERWQASGLGLREYVDTFGWEPEEDRVEDWAGVAKRQKAKSDPC